MDFPAWAGKRPALVTCMGDTITHLPDRAAGSSLLSRCAQELAADGRLVVSFRDYSQEPAGTETILPVRRDENRIFLCRLRHSTSHLIVTDILSTRTSGKWERVAGSYPKLVLRPESFHSALAGGGLEITSNEIMDGVITIVARKQ